VDKIRWIYPDKSGWILSGWINPCQPWVLGTRGHLDGENDKGVHSVEIGSLNIQTGFFSEFANKP